MTTSPAPTTGGTFNTVSEILGILGIALNALTAIPGIGGDAVLASVFITIIQKAMNAYHAAAGVPLDLSKLPMETPVA
jgi:hypothetical protein